MYKYAVIGYRTCIAEDSGNGYIQSGTRPRGVMAEGLYASIECNDSKAGGDDTQDAVL